jgi:hypothetical protein
VLYEKDLEQDDEGVPADYLDWDGEKHESSKMVTLLQSLTSCFLFFS